MRTDEKLNKYDLYELVAFLKICTLALQLHFIAEV